MMLNSLDDTKHHAEQLAKIMQPGDMVALKGTLGSGKTTLSKMLIAALCDIDSSLITSPTFNLLQTYETAKATVWHADLYRLENSEEYAELGLDDMPEDAICVIEWPEIIAHLLPNDYIGITLNYGSDKGTREIIYNDYALKRLGKS